jgi:putative peptide maturation system protein
MTSTPQQALVDTLDYLKALARDATRPDEARARLRLLQEQHPAIDVDLVWEEVAYDRSTHYDVLLHLDGGGTASLSFCPDHAVPWPMRGVHRVSEADLVRVNATVLQVDQAISCLDILWDEARLMDRLVNVCLVQEALDEDPVTLSDADLQRAMDGFRRAHKLYKAEDTQLWMERTGMTPERLEWLVASAARVGKLRDRVSAGRVEEYFAHHRDEFAVAFIARIVLPAEKDARQTYERIRAGEVDFYEAARRRFLAAPRREPPPGDVFTVVQRGPTDPELAAAVFAAAPGALLGPLRTDGGYAVVRVLSIEPACLDGPTREAIQEILFEEWLERRRRAATIEWYWGDAGRTAQSPAR